MLSPNSKLDINSHADDTSRRGDSTSPSPGSVVFEVLDCSVSATRSTVADDGAGDEPGGPELLLLEISAELSVVAEEVLLVVADRSTVDEPELLFFKSAAAEL